MLGDGGSIYTVRIPSHILISKIYERRPTPTENVCHPLFFFFTVFLFLFVFDESVRLFGGWLQLGPQGNVPFPKGPSGKVYPSVPLPPLKVLPPSTMVGNYIHDTGPVEPPAPTLHLKH